jgi:hypothetical protein
MINKTLYDAFEIKLNQEKSKTMATNIMLIRAKLSSFPVV